jgi:hypothetical protein
MGVRGKCITKRKKIKMKSIAPHQYIGRRGKNILM